MFGSRHEHFSDAKRLAGLKLVKARKDGITAAQFAAAARSVGWYTPRDGKPSTRRDIAYGHRLLKELLKDGLVKRSKYSIKYCSETKYHITRLGLNSSTRAETITKERED